MNALRGIVCFGAWAVIGGLVPWMASASSDDAHQRQLLWGDTHLHTSYSADAFFNGTRTITPGDAYRFARGATVVDDYGRSARLKRPLDFLVVADHAEYLGLIRGLDRGEPAAVSRDPSGRWRNMMAGDRASRHSLMMEVLGSLGLGKRIGDDTAVEASAWARTIDYAEQANQPGVFTAFAGFEWTSSVDANNLHRVVIFRDGADRTRQVMPYTSFDSNDPEHLWTYLANYEASTGGRVLAIPHNGNLSNGLMFGETTLAGESMDRSYTERRARWEPVVEVTQIKGDGETHPRLSPNDEYADYGRWDTGNFAGRAKEPWMFRYEYARSALRLGLQLDAKTGVNPYRFGMIGSTDSHTGLSGVAEDNFVAKAPGQGTNAPGESLDWKLLAGGYAAVWAKENTREAIFDAMLRREVYATTGPRITVRTFGGWHFGQDDELLYPDRIGRAYEKGVPMGGTLLTKPPDAKEPVFLIAALKDPDGANLESVQIVKGWLDAAGGTHEMVHEAVRADPADLGAAQLTTLWSDPDFDPDLSAFYYVRVLEVTTPRWILRGDRPETKKLPEQVVRVQNERAYTSPIWYLP